MKYTVSKMPIPRRIALVAHDHRKGDMIEWVKKHREKLTRHKLYATGTTGKLLEEALKVEIKQLKSGPLGGDQQLGALITDLEIDTQLVPIVTDQIGAEAGKGGAIKKVGAGALIGSAIDGSSGAGTGAAIGGALALLGSRRNHIQIPADYQVEVSLKQPLILNK